MHNFILSLFFIFFSLTGFAKVVDTTAVDTIKVVNEKVTYWEKANKLGLSLNAVSYTHLTLPTNREV